MGCGRIDAELSRCLPTRQLHELQLRADEVIEWNDVSSSRCSVRRSSVAS